MNWIERLPEIKGKDLYSQNSEGLILEYIYHSLSRQERSLDRWSNTFAQTMLDIGSGDGFILSNSRHLSNNCEFMVYALDKEFGTTITLDNCLNWVKQKPSIISIDTDGNDYWLLDKMLPAYKSAIVCAEFNAMYTDSRTIKYNPFHEWAGDSYYGFTFEAGKKLAEKHGYKVIFQLANMNMFMVRGDLIEGLTFPEVTYKQNDFFKLSTRNDWVTI